DESAPVPGIELGRGRHALRQGRRIDLVVEDREMAPLRGEERVLLCHRARSERVIRGTIAPAAVLSQGATVRCRPQGAAGLWILRQVSRCSVTRSGRIGRMQNRQGRQEHGTGWTAFPEWQAQAQTSAESSGGRADATTGALRRRPRTATSARPGQRSSRLKHSGLALFPPSAAPREALSGPGEAPIAGGLDAGASESV